MGILAIIPARSGSKGLVDKNIRLLNGKPLMAYSIEAAIESNIFDVVHVSTDSEKYAQIAREYGADVRFLRSENNASDTAGSWEVVTEVLKKYEELGVEFEKVCLLQPTSPLRNSEDIKKAYELMKQKEAKAVVSVCEVEHSPYLCNVLQDDDSMEGFITVESNEPRQKLKKNYRINGAIYVVDIDYLRESNFLYRKGCFAYKMDSARSVDIDLEMDFKFAEFLIKEGK